MLNIPERVKGIFHPLITDVYLKNDYSTGKKNQKILIIETLGPEPDDDHKMFDSYLIEILGDLKRLKKQVQEKIGPFNRIDIRAH